MPIPVWLDTDIGTDVDDAVALALALRSPEIELVGVSTVYGDVDLRSRMVLKLLKLAGRADVPVYSGTSQPMMRERPVYWGGWEGEGLLAEDDRSLAPRQEHAVTALMRAANDRPGEISLVTIGPMTNAALAFSLDPELADKLRRLVVMGGATRTGPQGLGLPIAEHNLACDPEAASLCFRSGAEMVMVGLDVTTQVWVDGAMAEQLRRGGGALGEAVAGQLERYLAVQKRERTMMHDPLALSYLIRPGFLELVPAEVQIETRSELASGATWVRRSEKESRTQVAVGVDARGFEVFLLERLVRA